VDASSDVPIDVITLSTEHGPTEHGIAGPARARSSRGSAGGLSKIVGCAGQRVLVAWVLFRLLESIWTAVWGLRPARPLWTDEMVHCTCARIKLSTRIPEIEGEVIMFTNANSSTASVTPFGFARRSLLGMVVIAAAPLSRRALAETPPADATSTIEHFNGALLAAMKSGGRPDFSRRFQALASEIDQAFDLSAVLSVSVGPSWASLPPDRRGRLLDAFRRYTVASYVASFNSYAGQTFTVSPDTRSLGVDRVVVQSRIVKISGDATELDYVMKRTPSGWKVVDVLAEGSISRVAMQRSDFRRILSNGGGDALLTSLQRKTSDLSGGALVYRIIGNSLR
jgi:phospholipid transport system substrate-binding protein